MKAEPGGLAARLGLIFRVKELNDCKRVDCVEKLRARNLITDCRQN